MAKVLVQYTERWRRDDEVRESMGGMLYVIYHML
jgi:hypothetical protein